MINPKKRYPLLLFVEEISSDIGHGPGEKGKKWEVEAATTAHWR